jgi:hypothetical protein
LSFYLKSSFGHLPNGNRIGRLHPLNVQSFTSVIETHPLDYAPAEPLDLLFQGGDRSAEPSKRTSTGRAMFETSPFSRRERRTSASAASSASSR